jgi:hypothetical protein
MKLNLLLVLAGALMIGACSKIESSKLRGGGLQVFPKPQAVEVLTRAQRWCAEDNGDDVIATWKFLRSQTGEVGLYNLKTQKFDSLDPITWDLNDDVLTLTLHANVTNRQIRFSGPRGQEKVTVLGQDKSADLTFSECNY